MKGNRKYWRSVVVWSIGFVLGFVVATPPVLGDDDGAQVISPTSKKALRSYQKLAGDWWNWAVQFPFATNPINEDGSVDCTRGQKGKIWFLAGTFGETVERDCTIPEGKSLFFPIVNALFWVPEDGADVAAVRAGANAQINLTTFLEVIIDGVVIADPFAYRAQSPPGGFALNFGPLLADFGYGPTPDPRDPAVADGYWILLAPLEEGEHAIVFRSDLPGFNDVTYHLTVGNDDD